MNINVSQAQSVYIAELLITRMQSVDHAELMVILALLDKIGDEQ